MSERQMRKMISYKIENLSPKERAIVDEWANGQFNIQQSLTNIIMHIVGFVGNVDVMDFDVQKKLHITLGNDLQQRNELQKESNVEHEPILYSHIIKPRNEVIDEYPDADLFTDD